MHVMALYVHRRESQMLERAPVESWRDIVMHKGRRGTASKQSRIGVPVTRSCLRSSLAPRLIGGSNSTPNPQQDGRRHHARAHDVADEQARHHVLENIPHQKACTFSLELCIIFVSGTLYHHGPHTARYTSMHRGSAHTKRLESAVNVHEHIQARRQCTCYMSRACALPCHHVCSYFFNTAHYYSHSP